METKRSFKATFCRDPYIGELLFRRLYRHWTDHNPRPDQFEFFLMCVVIAVTTIVAMILTRN